MVASLWVYAEMWNREKKETHGVMSENTKQARDKPWAVVMILFVEASFPL